MNKWKDSYTVSLVIVLVLLICQPCFAANSGVGLTWDDKAATLKQIAERTSYDLVDANGDYKPLYTFAAEALWNDGLFSGSNGSFDLDMPLTREQGTVMILRILGKDKEASAQNLPCKFVDVAEWAAPYVAYAEKNGLTSGISATEFGGSNVMNANQFCTFALRALGYKDGEDFTWSKAVDKALEIGLIGESCHLQYSHSNLFLRDNAVMISYNALYKDISKTGGKLISIINVTGKPVGNMPSATKNSETLAQAVANSDNPKIIETSKPEVFFESESTTVVRKLNGTIDYVYTSFRLNFICTTPERTTFRIVQALTPTVSNTNQEKSKTVQHSSNSQISGTHFNGTTLLSEKLYRIGGSGDSKYNIFVYVDATNELIGSYELLLEDGGSFNFK